MNKGNPARKKSPTVYLAFVTAAVTFLILHTLVNTLPFDALTHVSSRLTRQSMFSPATNRITIAIGTKPVAATPMEKEKTNLTRYKNKNKQS